MSVLWDTDTDTFSTTANPPPNTAALSAMFAFKRLTAQNGTNRGLCAITNTAFGEGIYVRIGTGNTLEINNLSVNNTGVTPPVGTWAWLAFSRVGAGGSDLKAYYRVEGDIVWQPFTYAGGTFTTANNTRLGSLNNFNWTNAEYRKFCIWDAVLSEAEFTAELASLNPVRTANLRRDMRLVDAATAGTDFSGNGYSMTASGLVDGASNPALWSPVKKLIAGLSGGLHQLNGGLAY